MMAPCMVEIQDNNNLGVIRFLVTSEEHQLNRAKADVYAHFANEADFKARQVIIIEWNGLLSEVRRSYSFMLDESITKYRLK